MWHVAPGVRSVTLSQLRMTFTAADASFLIASTIGVKPNASFRVKAPRKASVSISDKILRMLKRLKRAASWTGVRFSALLESIRLGLDFRLTISSQSVRPYLQRNNKNNNDFSYTDLFCFVFWFKLSFATKPKLHIRRGYSYLGGICIEVDIPNLLWPRRFAN